MIITKEFTKALDRFNKGYKKLGENDCWLWQKSQFQVNKHSFNAHRFSFYIHNGFLPRKRIYHACNNSKCINPKHLYIPGDSTSIKPLFDYLVKKDNINGCWEWCGSKDEKGYGLIPVGGNKSMRAHRYSYRLFNGSIKKGLHVLHKCDNPTCVNPKHLFLGTNNDNIQDKVSKNRHRGWRFGKPLEERIKNFLSSVQINNECWIYKNKQIYIENKTMNSYRFSFFIKNHYYPTKKRIKHSCGNLLCVNPDHLYLQ